MILHIVIDHFFIDMAYGIFEKAYPNNNEFILVSKHENCKYIKKTPITTITTLSFLSKKFSERLKNYEFVVIHWLDDHQLQLIVNAPKEVKFVWLGWGGDYYSFINKPLLLDKTKKAFFDDGLLQEPLTVEQRVKDFIKNKFFFRGIKDKAKAINRINYFAPVLYEDYCLVKESLQSFTPKYIDWNYGTLEDDLIVNDLSISGNNILLGNSASYENNHMEAIDILAALSLGNRDVICPLSYGDDMYADRVQNYGQKKLGKNFQPIKEFLPMDKYNNLLASCSIVIMNHLRQQALGNIIITLFFGAKLFLNKENPIYDFLMRHNIVCFTIDQIDSIHINTQLTSAERLQNKKALKAIWSRNKILFKTVEMIKVVNEEG